MIIDVLPFSFTGGDHHQLVLVNDRNGVRYLMRIRPYKTMDNKIEGAVLVLVS